MNGTGFHQCMVNYVPVIVVFAVYVAIPGEAGELSRQWRLTLAASETSSVPTAISSQKVEPILNSTSTASTLFRS